MSMVTGMARLTEIRIHIIRRQVPRKDRIRAETPLLSDRTESLWAEAEAGLRARREPEAVTRQARQVRREKGAAVRQARWERRESAAGHKQEVR